MNSLQQSGSRRQLLGLTGAVVAGTWAVQAGSRRPPQPAKPDGSEDLLRVRLTVTHVSVKTLLVTPGSPGHQLGDLRVLPATAIQNLTGATVGRMDAVLTTTSVDYPGVGDEVRIGHLHFIFGTGDLHLAGSANQVLVAGSGFYPGTSSTIAVGSTLVRPIIGGSGQYSGAIGSATSEHMADGSWRHTLDFLVPAVWV